MKVAIQRKNDGNLVEVVNLKSLEDNRFKEFECLEVFPIEKAHKVLVQYTELGGPYGYGHSEPAYTTFYDSPKVMVSRLLKWIEEAAEVFGPDRRDIRDFFTHCTLFIDGERKDNWFEKKTRKFYVNENENNYDTNFIFPIEQVIKYPSHTQRGVSPFLRGQGTEVCTPLHYLYNRQGAVPAYAR